MGIFDNFQWGLNAHPDDSPGFWGARAILNVGLDNPIDLLPDRQSGGGPLLPVLADLLNQGGGLKIAQARVYALLNNFLMDPREGKLFTLIDTDMMTLVANTNGSHGYLYLSAWLKPEAFDIERACWDGEGEPPKRGDVIRTSVWKKPVPVMSGINIRGQHFLTFLTGRKPRDLKRLREWRPNGRTMGDPGHPHATASLNIPYLAVGLTTGSELR